MHMQTSSIIYVDRKIADAEGIDLAKLVKMYGEDGVTLITDEPYFDDIEQRWVCPGCKIGYERDEEVWRLSSISGTGWQPLCRGCEGTDLDPKYKSHRLHNRAKWIGVEKKKPGKKSSNPVPRNDAAAGQGHKPRWRS